MTAAEPPAAPAQTWKADAWRLGLVLVLAVGLRAYMVANTALVSRDCVKFVRFALHLEQPPAGQDRFDVVRTAEHPPAYPTAILAMSRLVRPATGVTPPAATVDSMALSAQLASALAGVLLAIPFYFLVRRIFDRNTACAAGLLFTALPVSVEVTSDGLSDGLFLLTAVSALWFAVRALDRKTPRSAFVSGLGAGLCVGLGYLVRPEAVIVAAGIGLTFAGVAVCRLRGRQPWRPPVMAGFGLVLGMAVLMAPYMGLIGKLTNKPTGKGMMEALQGGEPQPSYLQRSSLGPRRTLLAAWWDPADDGRRSKAVWALRSVAAEYWKTTHYLVAIFAGIGLFALRRRLAEPGLALLLAVAGIHGSALWYLAFTAGYVSQRHTLLLALVSCVLAAASFPALGVWAVRAWHTRTLARAGLRVFALFAGRSGARGMVRGLRRPTPWFLGAIWTGLVLVPFVTRDFYSLHADRVGHRVVGEWLKHHGDRDIEVIDPFGWAEWYAERSLRAWPVPKPDGRLKYVIFEPNADSPHSRLEWYDYAKEALANTDWKPLYAYPDGAGPDEIRVAVYRCVWTPEMAATVSRRARPAP